MIRKIGVFGAGTMGTNIAQDFAAGGFEVSVYSRSEKTLVRSESVMRKGFELMAEETLLTAEQAQQSMKNITFTQDAEQCADGCDMVLETIVENPDAKRELFSLLDRVCPAGTVFASDTSALNIYELVPERRLPDTLITHYFAPAHLIPMVELVKGEQTRPELVDEIRVMYEKMGKIPVVIERVLPGFVINRLQTAIGREVNYLLDEGFISPENLDLAVKSSLMLRGVVLGVVQRIDFTGIDTRFNIESSTPIVTPPSPNNALLKLYEEGHFGVKTGKGFYDYGDREMEEVLAERDRRLIALLRAADEFIRNPV